MSENKRPRFEDSNEIMEEEKSNVGGEDDFVRRLDNLLKPIETPRLLSNEMIDVKQEDDLMKSGVSVEDSFRDIGQTIGETNAGMNTVNQLIPDYDLAIDKTVTRFPFSPNYKFRVVDGVAMTIDDYLYNQEPNRYTDNPINTVNIPEVGSFYKNVPWVQLENSYPCVSYPFRNTKRILEYNITNAILNEYLYSGERQRVIDDEDKSKEGAKMTRFDDNIIQTRRIVISNDIFSFLLIILAGSTQDIVDNAIIKYLNVIDQIYDKSELILNDREDAIIYGSAIFCRASLGLNPNYTLPETRNVFLRNLLTSAQDLYDYDTRIGLVTVNSTEKTLNNFLLDVKMSVKLFQNTLGISDVLGFNTGDVYDNWIKQFKEYVDNVKKVEIDPNAKSIVPTLGTILTTIAANWTIKRNWVFNSSNDATITQLSKTVEDMLNVTVHLKAQLPIVIAHMRVIGDKLTDQIKQLKKVEVEQKDEIKRLKKKIADLEKSGGGGGGSSIATAANVPLSSLLDNIGRNYLNLLLKEFLCKSIGMKLIYAIAGANQQKDISNYLNANLPQILLERLCFVNKDIKNWWQSKKVIEIEDFTDNTSPEYVDLLIGKLELKTLSSDALKNTISFYTSAPLQKAFYEVFSYVKLLHQKSRTQPTGITFDVLVTQEDKGVLMEMAACISAIITKEQDIQKQHATTRFDKPGINLNLVNAKLSIKMKMAVHLGFNFDGINARELI